jgi:2-oxoglutarate ferredoxin oxidoreductase subunit gamma
MYFDCVIAGFGGQGVLLMGNILAYAAMAQRKNVTYMPVYGVEMRGGTANCTVVISDREIGSPIVQSPASAVVMNRPSLEKFGPKVTKGGLLVVNTSFIPEGQVNTKRVNILMVPSRELALTIGEERLSNMIVLGALIEKSGIVPLSSMKKALYQALDQRYHNMIPLNLMALEKGAEFVRSHNIDRA